MIKVCFIVSSLAHEGPVNVMYNIIKYMEFSIYDVSIVTLIPEKKNSRMEEFKQFPIHIHQLAKDGKLNPLKMFLALKHKIKEIDPHLLHSHCPRSLYLANFLPGKYKRVHTIHSYADSLQKILYGKFKGSIVIKLNYYFTQKTDLPIGCAECISDLYKEKKNRQIMNIPNGISLPVWKGGEDRKHQIRQNLNLKEEIQYFIFIGRFSREKNPDKLIEAIKKINDPKIGLIMLGDGPMWGMLKKEENERIVLPGFKTNIYDYLVAADYYVSASEGEGLANTLLESMTVGLPLLLSDIPSHRDVMSKMSGKTGYMFDYRNMDDLIEKIKLLVYSLDKSKASDEIKKVFEQYYTAMKMSTSYQTAYADLYKKNK